MQPIRFKPAVKRLAPFRGPMVTLTARPNERALENIERLARDLTPKITELSHAGLHVLQTQLRQRPDIRRIEINLSFKLSGKIYPFPVIIQVQPDEVQCVSVSLFEQGPKYGHGPLEKSIWHYVNKILTNLFRHEIGKSIEKEKIKTLFGNRLFPKIYAAHEYDKLRKRIYDLLDMAQAIQSSQNLMFHTQEASQSRANLDQSEAALLQELRRLQN